jgi:hypothetical protein
MRKPRQMAGWRHSILAAFTPQLAAVSRLTVVSDPDGLLGEAGIVQAIHAAGFEIIQYHDHVAFRYAYETRFRQAWDRGEATNLVVVLRTESASVEDLPYDLLTQAKRDSRVLEFSIPKLFPALAPNVVAELERIDFDKLHEAVKAHSPQRMGENATRDFILRHVFKVDVEAVSAAAGLLHLLLRKHYSPVRWPVSIDARLAELLTARGQWKDWPITELVCNRSTFFRFLDERWPIFLKRACSQAESGTDVTETSGGYGLKFEGPTHLPFDNDHVRVYVDNLFIEGLLTPTGTVERESVPESWMAAGVVGPEGEDPVVRLDQLLQRIDVPEASANHHDWVQLAMRWGEVSALRWTQATKSIPELVQTFEKLQAALNEAFLQWLQANYASLYSLGCVPSPTMVHQVTQSVVHRWHTAGQVPLSAGRRTALVVMDGLALSQWVLVREALTSADLVVDDSAVFAWLPTLTCVSRQAIFYGDQPFYFGPSIDKTQKDEQHWRRFWEGNRVQATKVEYICQKKQEDEESFLARVREKTQHPRCRVLGVVAGTIDQMMHGAVAGMDGLQASVQHWADRGWPVQLVKLLLDAGFEVTLTSDHGNTECIGIGRPNVGVVADERGERAYVFPDELTRKKSAGEFPTAITWPPHGLPDGYFALLSRAGDAFITKGKRTVAHGGPSIEEVLVPYATIRKRP